MIGGRIERMSGVPFSLITLQSLFNINQMNSLSRIYVPYGSIRQIAGFSNSNVDYPNFASTRRTRDNCG